MATLAREFRLPTLTGVERASELPSRQRVTVDATGGSVFAGEHAELVIARRPEYELFEDTEVYGLLRDVLEKVAPLNLLHPGDQGFRAEACQTFHDITRFAHQRSMEEMFTGAKEAGETSRIGLRLKSTIPLEVRIIYVDQELSSQDGRGWVKEDEIASAPMAALWDGVREQGWPAQARPVNLSGFVSVVTAQMGTGQRADFSEASFALLSREYMILSLRLGYHFTTFESMCTDEPSKNYVRMQFKGGGASLDRRLRRIRLLMELLSRMGFEHSSKGDFLDSALVYQDSGMTLEKLRLLGRITMLTKQLDMALSNDAITDWYVDDFAKRLGLRSSQRGEP
jgi:pyruvate,water dikinase